MRHGCFWRLPGAFVPLQKAEDLLHTLGVDTAVDTSAVNELRYAGRHTLNALAAVANCDAEEEEKQISRAKAHCERAIYDAYDAAIFYYLKAFDGFEDDYKMIVVTDVLPDYVDVVAGLNGARRFLAQARSDADKRADYYDQARVHYEVITEAMERLQAARLELNKLVASYNAEIERAIASEEATEVARAETAKARASEASGRKQTIWIAVVTTAVNSIFWIIRLF